jgi:putative oxidoreductase
MSTTSMTSVMANPIRNSAHKHGAMALRLTLGAILLSHGLLKVLVFGIPGTVAFFEGLGLPSFTAHLTVFGELAGGAALLLGLYTRLVALLSLPILLGATWAHAANGWVFSNAGGGWEYPLLLSVLAVIVAVQGAGSFAIRSVPVADAYIPAPLRA